MKPKICLCITLILILTITTWSAEFKMDSYFEIYDNYRSVPENLMLMKHSHVVSELQVIQKMNGGVKVEQVGESVEKRSLNLVSFGHGPTKILLWSQMHGDEPTATASLLAIFKYFADKKDDPFVKKIKERLSIHALIMLNPDGAERFQRRNAFDIDINRDANDQQTPEGRILKKMQQRIKPDYGFNLHNMGGRETVEGSNKILKIALMAPPYNIENEDNQVRIRAKQVAVHIKDVLDNYIEGHVARYKADYMPRAFGDAMQFWGVSTVLIETGSYTGEDPIFLEKLNFVTFLSFFHMLVEDKLKDVDYKKYDQIPLEGRTVFDILIKDVIIVNGMTSQPFRADVGINVDYKLKEGRIDTLGYIKDVGDLSIYDAKKVINAADMILTPGFVTTQSEIINFSDTIKECFTTIIESDKTMNSGIKFEKDILKFQQIPDITLKKAKKFNLNKKGKIQREAIADILLFDNEENEQINTQKLKIKIVNGIIK